MDQVRLIVIPAFPGNIAPANRLPIFNNMDRFLKAHDLEVLLGRHAYVLLEQVNKVLLRITDFFAQVMKTPQVWLIDDAGDSILNTSGGAILSNYISGLLQKKLFDKLKHPVNRFRSKQLLSKVAEISSVDQVCLRNSVLDFVHWEAIEWIRSPLPEGNNEHPAASTRWNGDWLRSHTADPGITANLDFSQRFVVVNILGFFGQVNDNFGISVRQETVEIVGRGESIEID